MTPEQLDRGMLLRMLHLTGDADPALLSSLDRCTAALCEAVRPRTVWRLLPVTHEGEHVTLGTLPLGGRDIAKHLRGCDAAILLAATLTSAADDLIRRAEHADLMDAVMLDAAAGAAIEAVCDELTEALRERFAPEYPFLTERFSAGYGDFPLTQQRDLIQLLDAPRKIGLTVTPNQMLLPLKSVTAVIGLSKAPTEDARRFGCGKSCALCPYRDDCKLR